MTTQTIHHNSLTEEARHILEECRAVVVGVQALIGFQLIAILNPAFDEKLVLNLRLLHLGAMGLVIVSMFLLLTPAAYHRLAEPGVVSTKFVESSTRLMCWAMAVLRLGIIIEAYVAARALGISAAAGAGLAACLFLLSWTLWSVYPRVSIMRLAPYTKSD